MDCTDQGDIWQEGGDHLAGKMGPIPWTYIGPLFPAKWFRDVGLRPISFENLEFCQYNCPYGAGPLSDSYKIYRICARA